MVANPGRVVPGHHAKGVRRVVPNSWWMVALAWRVVAKTGRVVAAGGRGRNRVRSLARSVLSYASLVHWANVQLSAPSRLAS